MRQRRYLFINFFFIMTVAGNAACLNIDIALLCLVLFCF